MPTQRRPKASAAATVVPQPQKGSSTRSPGLEEAAMMRSSSRKGFCVGYPSRSLAFGLTGGISIQTESTISPFVSLR